MELSYDWGFGTNQLNGNISGNKWRSKGDGQQRAYGFGYDDANRLLFADFNQYASAWDKTAGVDFSAIMGDGTNSGSAYDENGNIRAMKQAAWQIGGSNPIDQLGYTYSSNSNKLLNVIDAANNPLTTLGDFRTSALSPYNTGKTNTAVDYVYDPNGNLTRDLNKDIGSQTADGIIYNHLNLPWQVKVRSATGTKGIITYIYDATGNKLKKTTLDSAGNLQAVTTYIGAFQYQGTQALNSGTTPADTLQFFGDEEGRVRLKTDTTGGQPITSFKYDYFLKDHLGNTRTVLTDEQETDQYPMASMEVGDSATENLYYTLLDETRTGLPPGYPTDTTTNPNHNVAELYSPTDGTVVGPGIVLKVMAGDQFSVRATSWYQLNGTTPGTPLNPLTDVVSALIGGLKIIPGEGAAATALQGVGSPLSPNVMKFLADTGTIDQTKPHAFLNWVLFDNQFNYVAANSGFQQVGTSEALTPITLMNLPVASSGYLYIYTSNATANVPVFFDNLQVTHTRGPLLEEDHYYPFGLTMAEISDKAIKTQYTQNKYRYNGKELQNQEFSDGSGLEEYDYGARLQDPQIGRWSSVDPLIEKMPSFSPYSYGANDPVKFIDLEGRIIGNPDDPATKRAQELLNRTSSGQELWVRLEASDRKIYFHNVAFSSKSTEDKNLFKYLSGRGSGITLSKTEYQNIISGKSEADRKTKGTFNKKTGDVDKSSDWDETHIVLLNLGLNATSLSETAQFEREAGVDLPGEGTVEAAQVNVMGEESEHALQDYYDENVTTYDEKTQTYTETTITLPYSQRKNENEAKNARKKTIQQYFQWFMDNHPDLFKDKGKKPTGI